MLLGFAGHERSIAEHLVEEAARDLDLNSVLADVYQMTPSGNGGKVLPIQEMEPPGSAGGGAGATPAPVVTAANILKDPGVIAIAEQPEKIVPAAEKSATVAAVSPAPPRLQPVEVKATVVAPASSSKAARPGVPAVVQSVPAGKNPAPPKIAEPVRAEAAAVSVEKKKTDEKRSESRAWWAKALTLTAVTGILAFVLGQEFSAQRPGQVEANGAGGSSFAQNSSGSGDSTFNPVSATSTDTPGAPSKNLASESRAARGADFNQANDVTVRKFPADSDAASDSDGKTQKLDTIFFDQDSVVIGSQYGPFLHRIADALEKNPGASAILEGHTDNTGDESL